MKKFMKYFGGSRDTVPGWIKHREMPAATRQTIEIQSRRSYDEMKPGIIADKQL